MDTPSQPEHSSRSRNPVRAVAVAIGLSVGGIVASQLTALPAVAVDPALANPEAEATTLGTILMVSLTFVGFVLVGAIYLRRTGRGWSYVDLDWPTRRELGIAAAGVVAAFVIAIVVSQIALALDLEQAEAQAQEIVGDDPTLILLMIGVVFLFNAPAEEFLFRNVVQKRLYESFTKLQAVVIASAIFALAHLPAYGLTLEGELAPLEGVLVVLVVLFGGSIVFGYIYARTENLVVPTLAHAFYNAIQFGLLYLFVVLDLEIEEAESTAAVLSVVGSFPF